MNELETCTPVHIRIKEVLGGKVIILVCLLEKLEVYRASQMARGASQQATDDNLDHAEPFLLELQQSISAYMSTRISLKMLTGINILGIAQHSAQLLALSNRHSFLARHLRKINLHIVRELVLVHTRLAEQHLL